MRLFDCRNRTLRRAAATHILRSISGFLSCLYSSNILVRHTSLPLGRSRHLRSQLAWVFTRSVEPVRLVVR